MTSPMGSTGRLRGTLSGSADSAGEVRITCHIHITVPERPKWERAYGKGVSDTVYIPVLYIGADRVEMRTT